MNFVDNSKVILDRLPQVLDILIGISALAQVKPTFKLKDQVLKN